MRVSYKPITTLYESESLIVQRAVRESDAQPVIIKRVRSGLGHQGSAARLRYEAKVLNLLKRRGAACTSTIIELSDTASEGTALVLEDIGGTAIAHMSGLTIEDILFIGHEVTRALVDVHRADIIHKDINPTNIIFAPDRRVCLIDFDIAAQLVREGQHIEQLARLEGTLDYISPEQTGRMNRTLDHRSDLYSLGITLYELLTHVRPFATDDSIQLLHAILTKDPPRPRVLVPEIPETVARIVEKLIAKAPEDRYQSAQGLLHDLGECLRRLRESKQIAVFDIATADRNERFEIPQRLYGREAEIEALKSAYSLAASGGRRLVVVSGPPGIGKSTLINELQAPITEHNGIFLSGKQEQIGRHVPFSALSQAIDNWVRHVMMGGEDSLNSWRLRVIEAVGNVGQALIDIVPAVELLIGPQKPLVELGPRETENRLLLVLQRFVTVLCDRQPAVLFLDDLQRADSATLRFFEQIMQASSGRLLVICAFRSNEVSGEHPLTTTLEGIARTAKPVQNIALNPLTAAAVERLVADVTRGSGAEITELAGLICEKTAGNPFFVHEFLKHLWRRELLIYSPEHNAWVPRLQGILAADVTDNVAEIMAGQLQALPDIDRSLVIVAACLGSEFTLSELSVVSELPPSEVTQRLALALQANLINAAGKNRQYRHEASEDIVYTFAHDRLRQVAYGMLTQEQAMAKHYQIARLLIATLDAAHPEEWVFDILTHYNAALPLLGPGEKRRVAELNYIAGKEAKRSTAYEVASTCLINAVSLLPEDAWVTDYELCRFANLELAEVEYITGQAANAQKRLERTLDFSRNAVERAAVQRILAVTLHAMGRSEEAVAVAFAGLRMLGFRVSTRPAAVALAYARIKWRLRSVKIAELCDLPAMSDERAIAATGLLSAITTAAYQLGPLPIASVVFSLCHLTLRYGNSKQSAYTFGVMSMMRAVGNRYAEALQWAESSHKATERWPDRASAGRTAFVTLLWSKYLLKSVDELVADLDAAYVESTEAGDVEFSSWLATGALTALSYASLSQFDLVLSRYIDAFPEQRVQASLMYRGLRQCVRCLQGVTSGPHSFDDPGYNEEIDVPLLQRLGKGPGVASYYAAKVIVAWVHRDMEASERYISQTLGAGMVGGSLTVVISSFFCCIARIERANSVPGGRIKGIGGMRKTIENAARHSPQSFAGLDLILNAGLAEHRGHFADAAVMYEQGCERLAQSSFTSLVAAACETAARFFLRRSMPTAGLGFIRRAHAAYAKWGASRKVAMLQSEFPELADELLPTLTENSSTRRTTGHGSKKTQESLDVDVPVLLRVTRAMSEEVNSDKLLQKILVGLGEASGASRVSLLLMEGGSLHIAADSGGGTEVPLTVTQFVARSRETLVLDDAATRPGHSTDAYLQRVKPRSLMCVPLLHSSTLKGIVYLENELTPRAFVAGRLDMVRAMASQAAIALENARVYDALEAKVAERTQELHAAHAHLVRLTQQETETEMAGGFAHEIRNALSGARYPLATAIPLDGAPADDALCARQRRLFDSLGQSLQRPQDTAALEELRRNQAVLEDIFESLSIALSRGLEISEQILEYAHVGHIARGDHLTTVNPLIDRILAEMRRDFERHTIVVNTAQEQPMQIAMREDHAYTILRNLIANAKDALASKPAGDRTLVVEVVEVAEDGQNIAVRVQDSGVGMSAETQKRIFRPFFTTKGAQGTGLGLGLCRRIAELYDGDLGFISSEAQGTTFTLTVPGHKAKT